MEVLTDSVDATRGAEHLQWAKKLYQVALEKKDEYHKEEALREIMAYYVTLKNYSELYQPNNGRRTHRCFLFSAVTNDDVTCLVCKMIAERMNAHLWKDEEFKDGLRFIFELPQ